VLINVLGCDGYGKSTQIEKLISWVRDHTPHHARSLTKMDIFDSARFPDTALIGVPDPALAHRLLPIVNKESRALWLISMNLVLIQRDPPEAGEIVILDGYWKKYYAVEAVLGVDESWMRSVCSIFAVPEATVLIDIDPKAIVARGRVHNPYESGCNFDCSDEAFIDHQNKVRSILLDLANENAWHVVDGDNAEDNVFAAILTCIQDDLIANQ
jgi:thymidylate kinase